MSSPFIRTTLTVISFALGCILAAGGCQRKSQGELLADKYCGSCHLPVGPEMLDRETWLKHVLPAMAPRLGIGVWGEDQYYPGRKTAVANAIRFDEWQLIVEYYKKNAPEKLTPAKVPVPLQHDWWIFAGKHPVMPDTTAIVATTMVKIDSLQQQVFSADGFAGTLSSWDSAGHLMFSRHTPSPVTDLLWTDSAGLRQLLLTCIGDIRALDGSTGMIVQLPANDTAAVHRVLMPFLKRPVQTLMADFNKDGLADMVVCAFGHNRGGLYYLQQKQDHSYEQHPVLEQPGALHAETGDYNKDGWPDIMALFAAGDESIWLFQNDRKGGFTPQRILRFPPMYGSTGFQLTDINHDGLTDIVYTCGDNADYSMILKPYHGIYIYLNKGDFKMEQAWYYPVNGCTKAIVADLDGDGDQDIASIAFFADLKNNPAEKCIFFEQTGTPLRFIPHSPPIEKEGRWICMDGNDLDGDGDLDVVLGNYAKGFIIQEDLHPDWKTWQPYLLLENQLRSR